MTPVQRLKNLGPKSTQWLESIGITTPQDLAERGVVTAYLEVKNLYPDRVSLNLLWGMQAALLGIPWRHLPDEMKDELKAELEAQSNL
jgi:DNA transformation protein